MSLAVFPCVGAASETRPTPSLASATCLLVGLIAGQAAVEPWIGAGCALAALAVAAPGRWRPLTLAFAVGLLLSWLQPAAAADLPAPIAPSRPVVATVRQLGGWRTTIDGWQVEVGVEILRQGAVVAPWPARVRLYSPQRLPGSRWRLSGYLRRSTRLRNGIASRPGRWRLSTKSVRLVEQVEDRRLGARVAQGVRQLREAALRRVVLASVSRPGGALAQALVFGEREALAESSLRGLRRVGLAHVTALSGLHLGVLAVWTAFLCRWAPPPWRWALVVGVTLAYLALGGARPSLVRSWLMVAAAGTAVLSQRSTRSLHALAWSAAGLAALEPAAVGELGFQLTFAASAGVVLGARSFPAAWSARLGRLARPLAATLGAQLATMPPTLTVFHWLPLWAWWWNLLLVPVVGLGVPLCFAWVGVALVDPSVAQAALDPLDWLAGLIAVPGVLPAGLLGGVPWGRGLLATAGLTGALWAGALRPRALLLAAICLLFASGPSIGLPQARTAVHFLDVGQGDSILVRDGAGALLVDGGGWRGTGLAQKALLPVLGRLGLDELEVVVLSHGDSDHCRGLLELAGYIRLREVWLAPAAARSDCGRRLLLTPGVRLRPLWAGHTARWRGWSFSVLNPSAGSRGRNEQSLVLRGASRGRRLLLTGDVGHRTEFEILTRATSAAVRADLLKVAHHGSAGSSSLSFLRAVRPALAVVSVGRQNSFGHPSQGVLERLGAEGAAALRTDLTGQVEVSWGLETALRVRTPGAGSSP